MFGKVRDWTLREGRPVVMFINGKRTNVYPVVIGGK